uniref:Mitochondrial import receptor subunit TOM20 n=1 Tax=Cryptomonas curvata TaxID=233186 RepID=A0A7S0QCR6_9CRYP
MLSQLEEQIQQARHAVDLNPRDATSLAKWGECLLELSMLKQGPGDSQEAKQLLLLSVEKLRKSLEIYPDNHNAMVVLASALNARAFLQPDHDVACELFEEAKGNFRRALELDDSNPRYKELLEAMDSAPQLHAQVMQQLHAQGQSAAFGMGGGAGPKVSDEDWFYDWLGWGILIVGSLGVVAMLNAKAQGV